MPPPQIIYTRLDITFLQLIKIKSFFIYNKNNIYLNIMNNKYVFYEDEYNSGDGMMTLVWGPPFWHTLHTVSFNYPINPTKEHKKNYFNFYNNLQNILPCKYCRDNLVKNLTIIPLTLEVFKNRKNLSKWVYNLHELINKMLNKKSNLSYEDVRDRYEHFRSRCIEPTTKTKEFKNIEKGCTEPLYGIKSKCVLNIIPRDNRTTSFKMDPKCVLKKGKKSKEKS